MHIRDAKNHEEVWLLDQLAAFNFEDPAFRSRDYVIAIDERTGEKTGFGRLRVHRTADGERCELTCIGVRKAWRGQGIGAHIVERLIEMARDQGFESVYALTPAPEYLFQFGFETVDNTLPPILEERLESMRTRHPDAAATHIVVEEFSVPPRLKRRFEDGNEDDGVDERPEDFGVDPETATYKYDVDRT
ncbi:N-acetyltransferase GCN5 [Halodesulfurarchaeum formicicum]|uniref:N-acetyltransferase GCN5 n=1 Tax=Halodesulfurarchaeum formicicum TaxID=1873524 RepID=A0A1D8S472_9EURY|nr:GNAT family N-acetyltransferase [Halodesulfurarchaeum formicicum]AOW80151.1 N-acetyltransferase GCN5 [Halodesulfurarchaeum formicicum]APE95450.1 N-acetyltransferase GCN5 [Halodesulfurarchaeum formicicum]